MTSLINLWIALLSVTVVVGAIVSCVPTRIPAVELANTSVSVAATRLVGPFLASLEDGRFGFPSGKFSVAYDGETRIVARELVWWQPSTVDLTKRIWRGASNFGGIGRMVVFVILGFYWAGLGIFVTAAEYAAKFVMRSKITATITPHGDSGSEVRFVARGASALLLRSRLNSAFSLPRLPPQIASKAGLTVPETVAG